MVIVVVTVSLALDCKYGYTRMLADTIMAAMTIEIERRVKFRTGRALNCASLVDNASPIRIRDGAFLFQSECRIREKARCGRDRAIQSC
jgi:hypothetical protein